MRRSYASALALLLAAALCARRAAARHDPPTGAPNPSPSTPSSLKSFQLCSQGQVIPGVRDDASGMAAGPDGTWWLVANHPLAAMLLSPSGRQVRNQQRVDKSSS
jgi:hypothetical protein